MQTRAEDRHGTGFRTERSQRQQLPPRDGNHGDEAPRQQQIAWGKQITGLDATPATILALFERDGHRFEARNLATALHRVGKLGGRRLTRDPRLERLIETCAWRIREFEPGDYEHCLELCEDWLL